VMYCQNAHVYIMSGRKSNLALMIRIREMHSISICIGYQKKKRVTHTCRFSLRSEGI